MAGGLRGIGPWALRLAGYPPPAAGPGGFFTVWAPLRLRGYAAPFVPPGLFSVYAPLRWGGFTSTAPPTAAGGPYIPTFRRRRR